MLNLLRVRIESELFGAITVYKLYLLLFTSTEVVKYGWTCP